MVPAIAAPARLWPEVSGAPLPRLKAPDRATILPNSIEPLRAEEPMSSKSETTALMARVMAARGVVDLAARERGPRPVVDLATLLQRIAHAPGGIFLPFRNLKELHR